MWVLGLGAVVYGQLLADVFIKVAYGGKWVEAGAGAALRVYSGYILLMALNGVIDAIGHAQSTAGQLKFRGVIMVLFSMYFAHSTYLLFSISLAEYGAVGIITSNLVSYVPRLIYGVLLLRRQLPDLSIADLLPELWTGVSFLGVLALRGYGAYAAAALLPHSILLYRCNRVYLLRTKQD